MKQRKLDTKEFLNTLNKKTDLLPGMPILEIAGQCRVLLEITGGSSLTVRTRLHYASSLAHISLADAV